MSDFEKQEFHPIAQVYEEYFVPALFQQWVDATLDAAQVQPGHHVLDVACGTGAVTRAAAERVGASGSVAGLDVSAGMLAVAASKSPGIEWRLGDAAALPFEVERFDAVVCQFGLMFFADQPGAIREMLRMLRPGGALAVTVWNSLDNIPGFATLVDMLLRLFGAQAADEMRPPFSLGDKERLRQIFTDAGIRKATITTHPGTARFPSIESWLYTNIKGWVLADMLDDAQYQRLLTESAQIFEQFVMPDGAVAFDVSAHVVSVVKA